LALIFLTALVQTWASRYEMNPDGISYLEVASAYVHHAWGAAINGYWNPLYPSLLAPALALKHSAGVRDFVLAHVVNLLIFTLSLLSFRFFFTGLLRMQRTLFPVSAFSDVPVWVWELLGSALFISCSLDLITITLVSADLLVAVIVFAVMGILLRVIYLPDARCRPMYFVLLGCLLGLGYLTKPVMLFFALIVMAVTLVASRWHEVSLQLPVLTLLVFSLIAGPYIGLVSMKEHRFTIGENGPLTYLFIVGGLPYGYAHGVRLPPGSILKHPPRLILSKPAIYEFVGPVPGSCPIWYDTSYWYDGVKVRFSPIGQMWQLLKNTKMLSNIIFLRQAPLCVALFALLLLTEDTRNVLRGVLRQWVLIVPAAALILLNLSINLQGRLIAPHLTVLWACFLGGIRPRYDQENPRVLRSLLVAGASLLFIGVIFQIATDAAHAERGISTSSTTHSTNEDRAMAAGLERAGIPGSASVAYVGDSITAYWAHLAGVRIVAEIPVEEKRAFLDANQDTMKTVLATLSNTGAAAVITPQPPTRADAGWQPVPGTDYYMHFLHR
jgi:hypothetical protein